LVNNEEIEVAHLFSIKMIKLASFEIDISLLIN